MIPIYITFLTLVLACFAAALLYVMGRVLTGREELIKQVGLVDAKQASFSDRVSALELTIKNLYDGNYRALADHLNLIELKFGTMKAEQSSLEESFSRLNNKVSKRESLESRKERLAEEKAAKEKPEPPEEEEFSLPIFSNGQPQHSQPQPQGWASGLGR